MVSTANAVVRRDRASHAEWIAHQLTEACGWEDTLIYLIRDRDGAYGDVFQRRFARWAFATNRPLRNRLGKMDIANA